MPDPSRPPADVAALHGLRRLYDAPHRLRWWLRWPLRAGIFVLVLAATLFPDPRVLAENEDRRQRIMALTDPTQPELAPWIERLNEAVPPDTPRRDQPKAIQNFVYAAVPYAFDWETYGVADHWPTIADISTVGMDDCDGHATLAAALLRHRGFRVDPARGDWLYDAQHVWLRPFDPQKDRRCNEILSPGRGQREPDGSNRLQPIDWMRAASFGVGVFPWQRELVWIIALLWLTLPSWRWRRAVLVVPTLVAGWLSIRYSLGRDGYELPMIAGWLLTLGAVAMAMIPLPPPRATRAAAPIPHDAPSPATAQPATAQPPATAQRASLDSV